MLKRRCGWRAVKLVAVDGTVSSGSEHVTLRGSLSFRPSGR
jgi:hypothetical protein